MILTRCVCNKFRLVCDNKDVPQCVASLSFKLQKRIDSLCVQGNLALAEHVPLFRQEEPGGRGGGAGGQEAEEGRWKGLTLVLSHTTSA